MKGKTLATLAILAGLSFSGCTRTEYTLPNEETIIIEMNYLTDDKNLIIKKSDGRIIKFGDEYKDGTVNYVEVTKDKKIRKYTQKAVLEEAQKQYDKYLEQTEKVGIDNETKRGLEDLK